VDDPWVWLIFLLVVPGIVIGSVASRRGRTRRFNPPPNWPAPPEGWVPPPGWQPDPAWGPAPAGWKAWR